MRKNKAKTKVKTPSNNPKKNKNSNQNSPKEYDFKKPFWTQDLGDEWDDYAWGADDF